MPPANMPSPPVPRPGPTRWLRWLHALRTLVPMLRDAAAGRFRPLPWRTIAALAGWLLYLANPFDLVPDMLPLVGQLDDATLFSLMIWLTAADSDRYERWRQQKP